MERTCICPMQLMHAVGNGSRSSKVKDDGANRQHMGDFLMDFYCNFNDFELELIKVIQSQRSRCQSEAHFLYDLNCVQRTLYLTRHSRYLMCEFCDHDHL